MNKCFDFRSVQECRDQNMEYDFIFNEVDSLKMWWSEFVQLLTFVTGDGTYVLATYLDSLNQVRALASLGCAANYGVDNISQLFEALWYTFAQVNAQYVLAEKLFLKSAPWICTCRKGADGLTSTTLSSLSKSNPKVPDYKNIIDNFCTLEETE